MDNIEFILKFATIYQVRDLLKKVQYWIKSHLSTRNFQLFRKLGRKLVTTKDTSPLEEIITDFIQKNADKCGQEIAVCFDNKSEVDPSIVIEVLRRNPNNGQQLISALSKNNKGYLVENIKELNLTKLYPCQSSFFEFLEQLTQNSESVDTMKLVLELQQDYIAEQSKILTEKKIPSDVSTPSHIKGDNKGKYKKGSQNKEYNDSKRKSQSRDTYRRTSSHREGRDDVFRESPKAPSKESSRSDKQALANNVHPVIPPVDDRRKIFVGNVSENITEAEVIKVFSAHGIVTKVDLVPQRKCTFVEFQNVKTAQSILKLSETGDFFLQQNKVYIKPFSVQGAGGGLGKQNMLNPEHKIFVSNIPDAATVSDIRKTFMKFGPFVNIDLVSHRKCCFIEFSEGGSVGKVLQSFAEGHKFLILNTPVSIKPFKTPSSS